MDDVDCVFHAGLQSTTKWYIFVVLPLHTFAEIRVHPSLGTCWVQYTYIFYSYTHHSLCVCIHTRTLSIHVRITRYITPCETSVRYTDV